MFDTYETGKIIGLTLKATNNVEECLTVLKNGSKKRSTVKVLSIGDFGFKIPIESMEELDVAHDALLNEEKYKNFVSAIRSIQPEFKKKKARISKSSRAYSYKTSTRTTSTNFLLYLYDRLLKPYLP